MNKNLYLVCVGAFSLSMLGCADDGISGSSEDPNVLTALGSSSSVLGVSSSSVPGTSSSAIPGVSSSSVTQSSSGGADFNSGDLWNPSAGDFSVNVARYAALLPEGAKADGHWTLMSNAENGDSSSIVWPADLVNPQNERIVVETCDGVCGTFVLKEGFRTQDEDPLVRIGFTLAKDFSGKPVPVDVSDWGGVCVTFTSDLAMGLELAIGDSLDLRKVMSDFAYPSFAYPGVRLPKTKDGEPKTICRKWSDFQIPTWMQDEPEYWKTDVGVKAAKQLVAFRFVGSGKAGEYKFNIMSFGTYSEQPPSSSSEVDEFGNVIMGPDYPRDLWNGPSHEISVKTALYADSSWNHLQDGQWFEYTDRKDGGNSIFDWYWSDQYDGIMAPFELIINSCDNLCCMNVILDQGELSRNPYALFGFKLAQDDSSMGLPVDISNWGGICVTYQSDYPIRVDLNPVSLVVSPDTLAPGSVIEDADLDIYKWPSVVLSKTSSLGTTKCYKWNEFTQINLDKLPNPDKYRISGEDVVKKVVSIRFIIEGGNGNVGGFFIKALGTNRD